MGRCPECGAAVPEGGSCQQSFDALLFLEAEIPGGPGELPHFFAVSAYVLQHPDAMRCTAETLSWLRRSVADALAGRASPEQLRQRARGPFDGAARVTRREGDPVPSWPVERWPMTVADVLAGGAAGYPERVAQWAASITQTLGALEG